MPHDRFAILRARRVLPAVALLVLAAGTACRQGALAFAGDPATARSHADGFLGALATRFTNVYRAPRFEAARARLGKHALTPSKLVADTGIWTSTSRDGTLTLLLAAGLTGGGQYAFVPRADAPFPARPGDSRHMVRLRPQADDQYEWNTAVDHNVGAIRADAIDDVVGGLLRAVETIPEAELRRDYRAHFPRTTAALGRLFTLDTLRSLPHREGGRVVDLSISIHPDRVQREFPAFAAYLRKYVGPARYRWVVRDRAGGRWMEAHADDDRLSIRVRTAGGRLLPLDGGNRPIPDALLLEGEFFAKVMIFTVGASKLRAELTQVRGARERGWHLRFNREPEWQLPLASRHLIKAPLRRPFEQGGTTTYIFFRDSAGGPTNLGRRLHIVVQESAILRWLGALGATAMSDFAGASEKEENRFIAEAFGAMRQDVGELLGKLD